MSYQGFIQDQASHGYNTSITFTTIAFSLSCLFHFFPRDMRRKILIAKTDLNNRGRYKELTAPGKTLSSRWTNGMKLPFFIARRHLLLQFKDI